MVDGRDLALLSRLERWPSLEAFYAAEAARFRSGAMDFGVWWRDSAGSLYRISAVGDTGELYAFRLSSRSLAPGAVFLIGRFRAGDYDSAEAVLPGWAEKCGGEDSLLWALEVAEASLRASG